jgi:endoglucanase
MAHWYWKVEQDPEIHNGVFGGDWRNADLVVRTSQMDFDTEANGFKLVGEALQHSTPIVHMDTGGWSVEIRRVDKLHTWEATADPMLVRSWSGYLSRFVQQGKVVDPQQHGETTSEGQSYALLRAVYMNDRQTFDEVWNWTKTNLQVRDDGLLAWHWGKSADGKEGVLDLGAATDADEDTALALLFASQRWNAPEYREAALHILRGIWDQETTVVGGRRVLVAGNWARGGGSTPPVVNPSYLAPYAYRIFAQADPDHPWMDLVGSSYVLLDQIARSPEMGGAAGLVGNWVTLDPSTGAPVPASEATLGPSANLFSYDASRLLWRLALDWLWFKDDRARHAIAAISLPARELAQSGRLAAEYRLDGTPAASYEAISMYAGTLGGLLIGGDQEVMHRVFAQKILQRYVDDPHGAYFGDVNNYYDQNWAWFATALMDGSLGNLWAGDTTIDWNAALAGLGTTPSPAPAPTGAAGSAPSSSMILGPGG